VDVLIAILALALLVVVILVVSAPLRAARSSPEGGAADEAVVAAEDGRGRREPARARAEADLDGIGPAEERAELEVAREAKYREIRDTELDYRTGKLSQEDFAATDGALRAEAVEILDRLASLDGEEPGRSR
jgi:hypothetical protein